MYLDELKQMKEFLGPLSKPLETLTPLKPEEREVVYAAAFGLYEVGDYPKAAGFFTHLILQDPFEVRFWKGLASSRQMAKEYTAALHAWAVLSLLYNQDPLPHFHAAECLISVGNEVDALKALQLAAKHCKETDPLFQKIKLLKIRLKSDV